ncbi:MAG: hypothetical protein ACK6A9_05030 [Dolichospermum sp.]|jgi:hypothetical protein|uniref:hypothetical protein n=1 Tax=Dolichospermum circinale TaxID=109265 RepID=UPI002FEDEC54
MQRAYIFPCPNCGSEAKRQFLTDGKLAHKHSLMNQIIRTECPVCDYLMVMRSLDGSVIEAYAPGIPSNFKPLTTSHLSPEVCEQEILMMSESISFCSIFFHVPNQNSTDSYSLL